MRQKQTEGCKAPQTSAGNTSVSRIRETRYNTAETGCTTWTG